jgi:hypothetical protein
MQRGTKLKINSYYMFRAGWTIIRIYTVKLRKTLYIKSITLRQFLVNTQRQIQKFISML